MKRPQLVVTDPDIARHLADHAAENRWLLRTAKTLAAARELGRQRRPTVAFLTFSPADPAAVGLVAELHRTTPDTAVVAVCDEKLSEPDRAAWTAVLMDLGLVQLADEVDGSVTRTTQFVGTLRYASPEQLLGRAMQIDRRTDVYSLGVTLWELLTLRPLYGADEQTSTPELIQRIQGEEPEPIRKYYSAVDRDLEAIVMKCLEKARGARYATAADLSIDLGCWLRGDRPQGVRSSSLLSWRKFAARHKRRATIGAALAAMLAATAMLTAHFAGRGEKPAACVAPAWLHDSDPKKNRTEGVTRESADSLWIAPESPRMPGDSRLPPHMVPGAGTLPRLGQAPSDTRRVAYRGARHGRYGLPDRADGRGAAQHGRRSVVRERVGRA